MGLRYEKRLKAKLDKLQNENNELQYNKNAITKIWKILGIESYEQTKGKSVDELVAELQAENISFKEQLNPIREWYGGGTEGNRPDIDILTDAMADLQSDRKELIDAKEKINLAIGGIDSLCHMTHNNPGYEDFQAVKQTLEGE